MSNTMNGFLLITASASARCAVSSAPLWVTISNFGVRPHNWKVPNCFWA